MRRIIELLGAATLAAVLFCNPASGQTVTDYASFKAALATGVVNNFAPNVNITLTSAGQTFEITNNTVIDGGTNVVVLSGGNLTRLFYVHTNCQLTLNNVMLTNGWNNSNGGAIYSEGVLQISNCLFVDNEVTNFPGTNGLAATNTDTSTNYYGGAGTNGGIAQGGAIYSRGPLYIYTSYFGNNTNAAGAGGIGGGGLTTLSSVYAGYGGGGGNGGTAYGAAVYSTGSTNVVYASEFVYNGCLGGNGGVGGAAGTNYVDPILNGVTGQGGVGGSAAGGALFIQGSLDLSNCFFYANIALAGGNALAGASTTGSGYNGYNGSSAGGGAIYLSTPAKVPSYLVNAVFFDNSCAGGDGSGASATNSVAGSGGGAYGGGLDLGGGTAYVRNCTFATNIVAGGSFGTGLGTNSTNGIVGVAQGQDIFKAAGTVELSDSILAGVNHSANGVTDAGYNIVSDESLTVSTSTTKLNTSPLLDSTISSPADTVIGPFGGGRYLFTLTVLSGSPAIGALPGVPGLTFPATDEQLQDRPTPATIGAYEPAPLTLIPGASPPSITTQPANETADLGKPGDLSVIAAAGSGDSHQIGYQWLLNGTNIPLSGNFSNVNSANLIIKSIADADLGAYQVVISPSLLESGVTSTVAYLLVNVPAKITSQPSSKLNVPYGAVVVLKVGIGGAPPFFYQWYSNNVALTDGNEFSGTTNSNLTINPVMFNDAAGYTVVVSNYFRASTSVVAHLTVVNDKTLPKISITAPAAGARTSNDFVYGIASDNAQVTNVICAVTNISGGVSNGFVTDAVLGATGANSTTWAVSNVFLPGTNIVTVQSVDYSSNVSKAVTRKFFYVVPSTLTLNLTTGGTVTGTAGIAGTTRPANGAVLNVGEGYTLVAHPAVNYLLSNWTSLGFTVYSNVLHFTMTTNLSITANFVVSPFGSVAGTYNGLFYEPSNDITPQTAGMISGFTISKLGAYSGKLLLGGNSYTLAGNFNLLGQSTNRFNRSAAAGGPLGVSLILGWTNSAITGTVSSGSGTNIWTASVYAEEAAVSSNSESTVLLIPSTNGDGATPPGSGYILITNHQGAAILTGALGDGTTLSESVKVGALGNIPVYKSLYSNKGLLIGWIDMTNGLPIATNGMIWIKPASKSDFYGAGFTNLLSVLGSPWIEAQGFSFFGELMLSNSTLDSIDTVTITADSITSGTLKGTVNPKTGAVKVTVDTGVGKQTQVGYAALLQNLTNFGGYFVTKTEAGSIFGTTNSLASFVFSNSPISLGDEGASGSFSLMSVGSETEATPLYAPPPVNLYNDSPDQSIGLTIDTSNPGGPPAPPIMYSNNSSGPPPP